MQRKIQTLSFLRGLETTGLEDGLELPAWAHFQNVRLDEGAAKRRPGMQRVLTAGNQAAALDFVAASKESVIVPGYSKLSVGRNFTVGMLFDPDGVSGTQILCDFTTSGPFRIYMDGATLKADVYTAGGTVSVTGGTITANATNSAQLVWRIDPDSPANYEASLWTNGTQGTQVTGTYSAPVAPGGNFYIGQDDSSSGRHFDGTIDFIRVLDVAWNHARWVRMRLPDPKASYVRLDMPMTVANATTGKVLDRSPQRNHGSIVNTPDSATTLAVQVTPVTHIGQRTDYSNASRLDVVAGGKIYLAEL